MHGAQSDLVREIAMEKFVVPARESGLNEVVIPVIKLRDYLVPRGFPANNIPQICSALEAKAFRREFEEVQVEGPASKRSTTVVFRCFFHRQEPSPGLPDAGSMPREEAAAWAERVTSSLFGAMKDVIAAHGGAEGYLRWVRSEDEEDAG